MIRACGRTISTLLLNAAVVSVSWAQPTPATRPAARCDSLVDRPLPAASGRPVVLTGTYTLTLVAVSGARAGSRAEGVSRLLPSDPSDRSRRPDGSVVAPIRSWTRSSPCTAGPTSPWPTSVRSRGTIRATATRSIPEFWWRYSLRNSRARRRAACSCKSAAAPVTAPPGSMRRPLPSTRSRQHGDGGPLGQRRPEYNGEGVLLSPADRPLVQPSTRPMPNVTLLLTSGPWKRALRARVLPDPLAAELGVRRMHTHSDEAC